MIDRRVFIYHTFKKLLLTASNKYTKSKLKKYTNKMLKLNQLFYTKKSLIPVQYYYKVLNMVQEYFQHTRFHFTQRQSITVISSLTKNSTISSSTLSLSASSSSVSTSENGNILLIETLTETILTTYGS